MDIDSLADSKYTLEPIPPNEQDGLRYLGIRDQDGRTALAIRYPNHPDVTEDVRADEGYKADKIQTREQKEHLAQAAWYNEQGDKSAAIEHFLSALL